MKINICYEIKYGPFGGGNQFLKALRAEFCKKGDLYADDVSEADIILFNSHHSIEKLINIKRVHPNKIYVHRVDGPMRLYNNMEDRRDHLVYSLNQKCANATVFQSEWSHIANSRMGMKVTEPFCVIGNAPDPSIFNCDYEKKSGDKFRLIASSWSDNIRKGFRYYKYLDNNLDFSKYQLSFAGRSPFRFKNIVMLGALNTEQVAENLKNHDAYLTASENDPCSNSLIEAMTCGLPAIALESGGHPELVGDSGLLFKNAEDLLDKLEIMRYNISEYRSNIEVKSILEISNDYISFFEGLHLGKKA